MNNLSNGSFRLFRVAGITVYLHWTWLLVAYFEIGNRGNRYQSMTWNAIEYVALFGIVLLHEFGHALACRQVGGKADRIMLWPLGGVAFVQPPPRPGALLWSIAAGPLVNVVLVPVTAMAYIGAKAGGLEADYPDLVTLLGWIASINAGLLIFNMLPIYPLDGGQILQALLWFVVGRARSLKAAGIIGLLGAVGVIGLAVLAQDAWLGLIAAFVAWQAWNGFRLGSRLQHLQPSFDVLARGYTALNEGKSDEAVNAFTEVIESKVSDPLVLVNALTNRGSVESRRGEWQRAIEDYDAALAIQPNLTEANNNLALLLAACPIESLRNGAEAVQRATRACQATAWNDPNCLGTLAAAHAEAGDFGQAVRYQEQALRDPRYRAAHGEEELLARLRLYEQGQAFRLPVEGGR
jgi:Zn-dependent protease